MDKVQQSVLCSPVTIVMGYVSDYPVTSLSLCPPASYLLQVNNTDFECYWCKKPSNSSGPKCRHFDFDVAIPVSGTDCPDAKYNVGTCESKFITLLQFLYSLLSMTCAYT